MQQIYIEVPDEELSKVGGAYGLIGKGGPIELTFEGVTMLGNIVGGNPNPLAGQTHEAG
jgi:hypothetical protein